MTRVMRARRWLWWAIGYGAVLVVVVVALLKARQWATTQLATAKSTADWHEWRKDVERQQTQPGPVERRVPRSEEPPALVLMRDNFSVSLFGAVLFSTALYWVMAWFVSGIVQDK